MSYAVNEDCRKIYMMTLKNTRKYENLLNNPEVSLLMDSREESPSSDRSHTKALTVSGHFERIENDATRLQVKNRLLERHPNLKTFAEDPDTEFFAVKVKSLQLLDGITDSSFISLD